MKRNETKWNEMDESNKICKTHSKLSESWINCKNIFFIFTLFCILIETAIAPDLNIVLIWVGWHRNRFFIIRRFFHIFYIINLKTHININRRRTPYSKPNRQYSGDLNIYLDICTYQNPRNRTNLLSNVPVYIAQTIASTGLCEYHNDAINIPMYIVELIFTLFFFFRAHGVLITGLDASNASRNKRIHRIEKAKNVFNKNWLMNFAWRSNSTKCWRLKLRHGF